MALEFDKRGEGHGLLPREIVTHDSIDNAMILDMAMGGSTNTVLHMLAVAREAGVAYDMAADQRTEPPDAEHLQGRPQQQLSRRRRAQRRRRTHDPRQRPARPAGTACTWTARRSPARRWARTSPTSTSAPATAAEEALELAAVTAGGRRNVEGMSVRPRRSARSANCHADKLGFDPMDCIREVGPAPTAKRAGW